MYRQKVFHEITSLISILLCITLTLGIFIDSKLIQDVYALDSTEKITDATALDNFDYTVNHAKQTVVLTKYKGTETAVEVAPTYTLDGIEYNTVLDSTTVFNGNTKITSVKLYPGVSFANNTTDYLFYDCTKLITVDMQGVNTTGVTSMRYMFSTTNKDTYAALTSINMSGIDTSSVTTMYAMFSRCIQLTNLIGYEDWNTSSLENMFWMFNYVRGMKVIDISKWDLSQVNNSAWCFQHNYAEQILLPDSLRTMSAGFLNHARHVKGKTFTIPAGVKKIGYAHAIYDFADAETNEFEEFIVAEGNENYVAVDGILYSADMKELIAVPRGKPFENNTFVMPEGVEFMGELSFSRNANIHTLVIPNSLQIECVPEFDDRYIVFEDIGNLNGGNSLSVALYLYTGVIAYEAKEDNPRYTSKDGILYSKDMSTVIAIPTNYNQYIDIPEGVTTMAFEASWGYNTTDSHMSGSSGINIPSTLVNIAPDQLVKLNRMNKSYGSTFSIDISTDNPIYSKDTNGNITPDPTAVAYNENLKKGIFLIYRCYRGSK